MELDKSEGGDAVDAKFTSPSRIAKRRSVISMSKKRCSRELLDAKGDAKGDAGGRCYYGLLLLLMLL